ncbi:MAG: thiamine pyrophosphate-binding protein [Gordonia sp. (in: high G+C Gram-positive bacteria)]
MSSASRPPTVAAQLTNRLHRLGITTVFGVHGANAEDIFDAALRHPGLTPVIAKHEFGAGAMADGLTRITGIPSAVVTTSGGGAVNVVAALAESYDSRIPVLAVIGAPPRAVTANGGFQDMLAPPDTIDLRAVLGGVTGYCRVIDDPAGLDPAFDAAAHVLRSGFPAALVLPKDIQTAPAAPQPAPAPAAPATPPDLDALTTTLLAAAHRADPLCLWAGEEAAQAGLGPAIQELADLLGATVVVSPGGRAAGTRHCAGVTGVMGHPSAHAALTAARVIVALGCRLSLTDRAGLDAHLAAVGVIHLGAHRPRLAGATHLGCPDLPAALTALTAQIRTRVGPRPPARPTCTHLPRQATTAALGMPDAVEIIGAALPEHCRVFADAGNAGAAAIHHLPFGAGQFAVALGMGGMGYGIAAGIGAAIGAPEQRTVIIAGDGAFLMHGMEIHTAIEHRAPVTLIVLNNNAHGMCVTREQLYFPPPPPTAPRGLNRFRRTDIAAGLAAMFPGLPVRRAADPDTLRAACAELLPLPGPQCLVIDVDADEIPPFAPFVREEPR